MSNNQPEITIRPASDADARALSRLAELDSTRVPQAPLLVAESDGEIQAALSVTDGAVIANPFRPTAELAAILRARAGIATRDATGLRAYRRLRPRGPRPTGPRPSAPSVPGFPVIPSRSI